LLLSGSLAQLVEQRTFNPLVAGSNPARPTTNSVAPEKGWKASASQPFFAFARDAFLQ
jgi:hypothetical protein